MWLTSVDPFLPKFCPKNDLVNLSVRDIRRQITDEWLEIVHLRAYRKLGNHGNHRHSGTIAGTIQWYHRWRLLPHIPPKLGAKSSTCTQELTSRRVLPPGEYDRTVDEFSFVYDIMSRAMAPFAKLLRPLFYIGSRSNTKQFFAYRQTKLCNILIARLSVHPSHGGTGIVKTVKYIVAIPSPSCLELKVISKYGITLMTGAYVKH